MPDKRPRGAPRLKSNPTLGRDPNHIKYDMSPIYAFQESLPSKRAANKCNEARVAVGTRQRLQQQNTVFTDPNHVKYDMCLVCTFQESLPSKRAANKCNEARVALSEATRCTPKAHCKAHGHEPTTHKPIRYTIRVSLLPAPRDF